MRKLAIKNSFSERTYKEKETSQDCQDAIYAANNCFALADGASQSFYSDIWAELIVENFCENPDIDKSNWKEWLVPIQNEWAKEVKSRVEQARSQRKSSWISNHNRLSQYVPATSTFIGLEFDDRTEDLQINLTIIGDSCLFLIEGRKLRKSYLLDNSVQFDDKPEYLASYPKDNNFEPTFFKLINEDLNLQSNESLYFLLASDALAEWFLKNHEQEIDVIERIINIKSKEDFVGFVTEARHSGEIKMKNDDVSLIVIEVAEKAETTGNDPVKSGDDHKEQDEEETKLPQDPPSIDSIPKPSSNIDDADETSEEDITKAHIPPVPQESSSHKLHAENLRLKKQKKQLQTAVIITSLSSVIFLILFVFSYFSKKTNTNTSQVIKKENATPAIMPSPEIVNLSLAKGAVLYDETGQTELITLDNDFSGNIKSSESTNGKKIEIELYVYASNAAPDKKDNTKINVTESNIRTSATAQGNTNTFGKLKVPMTFEKIYTPEKNWYKFKFVGYQK